MNESWMDGALGGGGGGDWSLIHLTSLKQYQLNVISFSVVQNFNQIIAYARDTKIFLL